MIGQNRGRSESYIQPRGSLLTCFRPLQAPVSARSSKELEGLTCGRQLFPRKPQGHPLRALPRPPRHPRCPDGRRRASGALPRRGWGSRHSRSWKRKVGCLPWPWLTTLAGSRQSCKARVSRSCTRSASVSLKLLLTYKARELGGAHCINKGGNPVGSFDSHEFNFFCLG